MRANRQAGVTLIEMLMTAAIGGLVVLVAAKFLGDKAATAAHLAQNGAELDLSRYLGNAIDCGATLSSEASQCDGLKTIKLMRDDGTLITGSHAGPSRLADFGIKATCRAADGGYYIDVQRLRYRPSSNTPSVDALTKKTSTWEPVFQTAPFFCPSACDPASVVATTEHFTLPSSSNCPWGVGDNNPKQGGRYAARIMQLTTVNVPAFSRMCNMRFNTTKAFSFDDNFALLYNGHIFATKAGVGSGPHPADGPTHVWSWAAIRGKQPPTAGFPRAAGYTDNKNCMVDDKFASGVDKSTCSPNNFPTGTSLNISVRLGRRVSEFLGKTSAGTANVELMVQGDDDNADCRTNGLEGDITYEYEP